MTQLEPSWSRRHRGGLLLRLGVRICEATARTITREAVVHVRIVSTVVEDHWLGGVDVPRTAGAIAALCDRSPT